LGDLPARVHAQLNKEMLLNNLASMFCREHLIYYLYYFCV